MSAAYKYSTKNPVMCPLSTLSSTFSSIFTIHRYILFVVRGDNSTVINCLKILIRLARTDKETAAKIFRDTELLPNCVSEFLPNAENISTKMQFYQRPQFIFLKLLRVIAAYELPVWELDIEGALKSYVYMKSNMSVGLRIR